MRKTLEKVEEKLLHIPVGPVGPAGQIGPSGGLKLDGSLALPGGADSVIVFAHGSGSSRHSPRNRFVANALHEAGFGTLLFDLLTKEEDDVYLNRFDIGLLTERLRAATLYLRELPETKALKIGYFGASTGTAAALGAAAMLGSSIGAIVSRGGRPDLAMDALSRIKSPTLLIVGSLDTIVIELNRRAFGLIGAEKKLAIVEGATHLFEEPGTLDEVAKAAAGWFEQHLHSK